MSDTDDLTCQHKSLRFECSEHSQDVGYKPRTALQRLAATLPSNKAPKKADRQRFGSSEDQYPASTFPAPLVLPEDELSWDPNCEPQSLKSWIEEGHRNEITKHRRTIYLVESPVIATSAAYIKKWASPQLDPKESQHLGSPRTEDVLKYLEAFYCGLPVKMLTKPKLKYVPWSDSSSTEGSLPSYIGLRTGSEVIGIRHRPSKDDIFAGQLNLNDLLDVAISILPSDAYALLMLTDHDLYEDEEDDFCCGRAYGGSRVAVVSTARYNPALDKAQHVETAHAWPASHCQSYIDSCCDVATKNVKKKAAVEESLSALRSAVVALSPVPARKNSKHESLWLSRLCKTASHELGHCFGIDHCSYYACIMQGTAGLSEDARQPPYLCPVDLVKVLRATGADPVQRYRALLVFCEGSGASEKMFDAFAAWLRVRIDEVESWRDVIVLE
ncbi:uncharacterized protein RCC_07350 [Ramularia collo-cygni]|uniref:Archaemetzincin-2 n=1 Tax=Ramularia collo-cygni TaxID=112498 RepID=A0A2D3V9P9_9PEZI|nr:uncharacterized protein RCC_07350 [Ramularia collo-cygni]CZT21487.1 uncharacterized protein RCC_07350 [Ramularia collo-cygni]